jgi:hypothetical protein
MMERKKKEKKKRKKMSDMNWEMTMRVPKDEMKTRPHSLFEMTFY